MLEHIHPKKEMDPAFSMISLTTNEPSALGYHNDDIDIFSWQCQGKSIWHIGESEKESFVMEPGDLVFCPAWTYHEVVPLTPRAAISTFVITGRKNWRDSE